MAAAVVAAAAGIASAPASAAVADPAAAASNWSTDSNLMTGDGAGNGVVIQGPWQGSMSDVERAAEVIPEPEWVPALQTVALGLGSFAAGWEIGSYIDTKFLHIQAPDLGTLAAELEAGAPGGSFTPVGHWEPCVGRDPNGYNCASDGLSNMGFVYRFGDGAFWWAAWNCGRDGFTGCPTASPAYMYQAEFDWLVNDAKGELILDRTVGGSPGYIRYMSPSEYDAAFKIDQSLQTYTGQSHSIATGWANPSTGAGETFTASSYGSGANTPQPCFMADTTLTCGGSPTSDNPSGTPLFPGLPSDPGFSDPNVNEYRCLIDPSDFYCPVASADGGTWARDGGVKFSVPVANPGESYTDYLARIRALGWAGKATVTSLPDSESDPAYGPGAVPCTAPSAGTEVAGDTPIDFYENSGNPSGGGGSDCSGGTSTPPGFNRCEYQDGLGLLDWDTQYAYADADVQAYMDQVCADIWQCWETVVTAAGGLENMAPTDLITPGEEIVDQDARTYLAQATGGSLSSAAKYTFGTPTAPLNCQTNGIDYVVHVYAMEGSSGLQYLTAEDYVIKLLANLQ